MKFDDLLRCSSRCVVGPVSAACVAAERSISNGLDAERAMTAQLFRHSSALTECYGQDDQWICILEDDCCMAGNLDIG